MVWSMIPEQRGSHLFSTMKAFLQWVSQLLHHTSTLIANWRKWHRNYWNLMQFIKVLWPEIICSANAYLLGGISNSVQSAVVKETWGLWPLISLLRSVYASIKSTAVTELANFASSVVNRLIQHIFLRKRTKS